MRISRTRSDEMDKKMERALIEYPGREFTHAEIAEITGMSRPAIYKIEKTALKKLVFSVLQIWARDCELIDWELGK